jgi:threonine synthase
VTLAGLKKLVADGRVGREETAVLLLTGHTLKDSEYTIKYHLGELLTEAEVASASAEEGARLTELRHAPMVLDADADAVLRAIDSHTRSAQPA